MADDGLGTLPQLMLTLIVAFLILYMGTYAMNATVESGSNGEQVSQAALLDGTQWTDLGDRVGKDPVVYNSLGHAVNLTGANDSHFETEQRVELASDDTWTVSTWARVDPAGENRTMTAVSANGRVVINYNGTDGNWTAWYYDDGSRDSYQVNVSAPDQPANLTNVQVVRNETVLTIYRNNTAGENVTLTNASSVDAPVQSDNFDGRVDEVRTFDDALTDSERQQVVDKPVAPIKATNRTARIMFDQPDRQTQLLFFSAGDVRTSNATFSTGLPGEKMDRGEFAAMGADYKWEIAGPEIKAISDGQLDGAPVAYVEYQAQSQLDTLADDWNAVIGLAGILFVLLPLGAIITYLYGIRDER